MRLGYGQTGQQNGIDDFYYTALYTRSDQHAMYPFGDNYHYTTRPGDYNPNLTWESTTTWNAGIDFSAMNGRFSVNVDGYYRKTKDLLSWVANQSFTNFGDQSLQNIGDLENYGVELSFNVKPVVTKDFTWDLSYNVGYNHNEITSLNAGSQDWVWCGNTISGGNNTRIQRNKVGEPVNSFFVYQQVYDEAGKPIEGLYVDRNADGNIDDSDRYYYKSPAAPLIMGLTTKIIWKRFDFSTAFHASFGNYVYYDFLNYLYLWSVLQQRFHQHHGRGSGPRFHRNHGQHLPPERLLRTQRLLLEVYQHHTGLHIPVAARICRQEVLRRPCLRHCTESVYHHQVRGNRPRGIVWCRQESLSASIERTVRCQFQFLKTIKEHIL